MQDWKELDAYGREAVRLGRCRFKGGGSSTTVQKRNIPAQSYNEARLENGLMNYNLTGLNNASGVLQKAVNSIDEQYTPNWNTLASGYNGTMADVANGYKNLLAGNLPSTFAAARQQALNDDLKGTVGNTISNLASRGVLDSSVTNKAMDEVTEDAANTLAKSYASDLGTYASLLNGSTSAALSGLTGNQLAQGASQNYTSGLFNYANNLASPAQNLYNTMYSGRMGTGSTTSSTSQNSGNSGLWSTVGTLGSAFIICFAGDTLVTTPTGYKEIKDVHPGDIVLSLSGERDDVVAKHVVSVRGPNKSKITEVVFQNGTVWHTTKTQRAYAAPHFTYFENADGSFARNITVFHGESTDIVSVRHLDEVADVYDITVEGDRGKNIFFANDVAAEGYGD